MLGYLQLKKDVRFFTSLTGLMNKCSVVNPLINLRQDMPNILCPF